MSDNPTRRTFDDFRTTNDYLEYLAEQEVQDYLDDESGDHASKVFRHRHHLWRADELAQRLAAAGARQFLVDGVLPLRAMGLMVGDSHIGKSALLYHLALCVAAGVPFFGHTIRRGPVLFFDYENSLDDAKKCYETLTEFLGLRAVPDNIVFWNLHDCAPDWNGKHSMYTMIRELRPALTIIDTLSKAFPEAEEKNPIATRLLLELTEIISDVDGSIVLSHHFRKPDDITDKAWEGLSVEDKIKHTRGPSALYNGVDLRIAVDLPKTPHGTPQTYNTPDGRVGVEPAFRIEWYRRMASSIPSILVERVFREDEPFGHRQMYGMYALSAKYEQVLAELPATFRPKDAEAKFPTSGSSCQAFLKTCLMAGRIVQQDLGRAPGYRGTKGYAKVDPTVPPAPGG